MRTIEVCTRNMPIYNSDLIQILFDYHDLSSKEQALFKKVLEAILTECQDIDLPLEFLELFVDGQKFSPKLMKNINFKLLLHDVLNKNVRLFTHSVEDYCQYETVAKTDSSRDFDKIFLVRLKNLANLAYQSDHPSFYFHQISISKDMLLEQRKEFPRIREEWLDFLPFLDMSDIFLSHVDIRNTNLANTNIQAIDFSSLYHHSILGTNLENVNLFGQCINHVDASSANLCGTFLTIDTSSTKLLDTVLDDSLLFLEKEKVINPVNQGYVLVKKENKVHLHL